MLSVCFLPLLVSLVIIVLYIWHQVMICVCCCHIILSKLTGNLIHTLDCYTLRLNNSQKLLKGKIVQLIVCPRYSLIKGA